MEDTLSLIVIGLCTGLGSALGNYLANRGIIGYLEKVKNYGRTNEIKRKGL